LSDYFLFGGDLRAWFTSILITP